MAKVSVLVAVYNAEKTLGRCLDSLLGQTLKDIEIMCVDDCSTDRSLEILGNYAANDSRVRVLHQNENMGQAVARNRGLKESRGEYVCYLDSDDCMSPDALERAVDVFEENPNTDCVLFRLLFVENGKETEYPMKAFDVISGYDAFRASLTWHIHGCYMTRSCLHKKYPYDDSCRAYSDDNTTRIHYLNSREVRCCDGIYYYHKNEMSVTNKPTVRRFDYLKANESMKKQLQNLGVTDDVMCIYETERWKILVDTYMFYFLNRKRLNQKDSIYGLSEIKRVWASIETSKVDFSLKHKFGYIPLRFSWMLFRIQENTYFFMKKLLGRI